MLCVTLQDLWCCTEGSRLVSCICLDRCAFFSISAQQNSLCILGTFGHTCLLHWVEFIGCREGCKDRPGQLKPDAIRMAPNKARVWQPFGSLNLCGCPTVATSLVRSLQSSLGHLYNFSSPTFLCKNSCVVLMPSTTRRFPLSVYPWQSSWPDTARENWNHSLWQPGHGSNELYKCPREQSHTGHLPWSLRLRATLTVTPNYLVSFWQQPKTELENIYQNTLETPWVHWFLKVFFLLISLFRAFQLFIQYILVEVLLCVRYYCGV